MSDCKNFINMLDSKNTSFDVKYTTTNTEVNLQFGDKEIVFEFDETGKFESVWSKDY